MSTKINSIDGYIENAQPFAKEILIHLRHMVNNYCPECEEAIKWSFPNFMYKDTILCSIAAFKQHASFGFWLQSQMNDPHGIFKTEEEGGMGNLGKIRSLDDLPSEAILGEYIRQAMQLVDAGVKLKKAPAADKLVSIPDKLIEALKNDPESAAVFENFSPSHKREYVEWLNDAKTEATFLRRLETTLSNLREGKTKEWKYQKR